MKNFEQIQKLIGNTPLVEIIYKYQHKISKMYAKLEWYNLSGSIKDRTAFEILKSAYQTKKLKTNQTICETTSGNMGIAICAIAKMLNNPVVICMPKFLSEERKKLLSLYGAKLELCDSFDDAFKKAEEYKKQGAYLTYQFDNPNNTFAHYKTTATEIISKLNNVKCFVSGVGTGGTLMGVGKFLKQRCNSKIVAIEPAESKILSTGKSQGKHKIQGLSDDIIPKIYDISIVDNIVQINSDDAICMAQKICKELGFGVGISSGANFLGCVFAGNDSVTVFADDNKKYLSTNLSKDIKSSLVDKITLVAYKVL